VEISLRRFTSVDVLYSSVVGQQSTRKLRGCSSFLYHGDYHPQNAWIAPSLVFVKALAFFEVLAAGQEFLPSP
jgi:hypothetical protein